MSAMEEAFMKAETAGLPASDGLNCSQAAVGWDDDLDMDVFVRAPSSAGNK